MDSSQKSLSPLVAVQQSVAWFREALFPVFCLGCKREGSWLCTECEALRPPYPIQRCVFCGIVSACGQTCATCQKGQALSGVTVLGRYREWFWRDLIRTWKYSSARDLDTVIGRLVSHQDFFHLLRSAHAQVCLPVPLAKRRERDRGFNQAQAIAGAVGSEIDIPVEKALKRKKNTLPQSEVGAEERKQNVASAFVCRDPELVRGKRCLLVDDIVTTGATLEEAARILKEAGAQSVWALALVRSDLTD